jgi:hypothetical protein
MLRRNRIKRKQGSTSWTSRTEEKVLTKVSAFFYIPIWLLITVIDGTLYSGISGTVCSRIVACFKMEIEHEDLHRNYENNDILQLATNQQLKKVVPKC